MIVATKTFSGRLVEIAATCAAGSLLWNCSKSQPAPTPQSAAVPSEGSPPVVVQVPSSRASAPPPEPAPPVPASGKLCPDGDWQPLIGLEPTQNYDYVAIMERLGTRGAAEMRWATGKACATAQQPQQCADELERLAQTVKAGRLQRGQILSQHWLATTRGDEVRAWTSREDWLGFLGNIDTPAEALLLAWYDLYSVECVEPTAVGYRVKASKLTRDCPMEITEYQLQVTASGKVSVQNSEVSERSGACVGRRPAGLATAAPSGNMAPLAAFFARVAHLEAAAVLAFQHVARELCAYRAPARLIEDTQRAIRDELCHARLMGRLALKLGGEPQPPAVEALPVRSLSQAALDNAVEGSLRETFGALVGTYQSMRAASPEVRRLLNDVAADERRHAALSWRLEHWFSKRLSLTTQREIHSAKRAALKQLRDEWSSDPPETLMKHAGLPGAAHAQRMLDGLEAMLHGFAPAPGAA